MWTRRSWWWAGSRLQFNNAFGVHDSAARNGDAVATVTAPQFSAAARTLAREEFGFAEARGPIGDQCAMRRAGDRVLIDAFSRREETRDEVAILAGRGDDYGKAVERGHFRKIGLQRQHFVFAAEDTQIVARREDLPRGGA